MDAKDFLPGEGVVAGIKADIERYETERRRAHRAVMWRIPVFDGLWIAAILGVAYAFNSFADPNEQWLSTPHVFLYIVGFFALFFIHAQAVKPATALQQSLRDRIMPLVFGFIEEMGYRHEATPESFKRMPQEASGAFNRQSFDDVISGRYEGFPFELYEATLTHKAGKSRSTVFKGVIVAFETIAPFPGVLVATRKSGMVVGFLKSLFGGKLEELQSGVRGAGRELRVPHRQCGSGAAAGDGPAGAGAAMARRDMAGTAGARGAERQRRVPADSAVEELLRTARDFAAARLQGACRADDRRHGRAARHRGAGAQDRRAGWMMRLADWPR